MDFSSRHGPSSEWNRRAKDPAGQGAIACAGVWLFALIDVLLVGRGGGSLSLDRTLGIR